MPAPPARTVRVWCRTGEDPSLQAPCAVVTQSGGSFLRHSTSRTVGGHSERKASLASAALALALVAAAPSAASPAAEHWIESWHAAPARPRPPGPGVPEGYASPVLDDQTIVQDMRLSAGGRRVRVRLTNEFGDRPLRIGAAKIALATPWMPTPPGASRSLTFSGETSVVIPLGATLLSDPVELSAGDLANVRISLYLPEPTRVCTCHAVGLQMATISPRGDYTASSFTPVAGTENRAFISGVQVETGARLPVIVAFGDSVTDGDGSGSSRNGRWTDRLAERLQGAGGGAVANGGISGNQLLRDAANPPAGDAGLKRFDRDVLGVAGVTHVIILEGANDIGLGGAAPPSAEALIAAYQQLIARGHAHGVKVIGATLTPFGGSPYFRPETEAVRQRVNAWIRSGHAFDGVIDFEAVLRDPAAPQKLRTDLQTGDGLHPNPAGYRAMGDAIELGLFR